MSNGWKAVLQGFAGGCAASLISGGFMLYSNSAAIESNEKIAKRTVESVEENAKRTVASVEENAKRTMKSNKEIAKVAAETARDVARLNSELTKLSTQHTVDYRTKLVEIVQRVDVHFEDLCTFSEQPRGALPNGLDTLLGELYVLRKSPPVGLDESVVAAIGRYNDYIASKVVMIKRLSPEGRQMERNKLIAYDTEAKGLAKKLIKEVNEFIMTRLGDLK